MRQELDNIYNAIGALSIKYQEPPKKDKPNPVGFAATETELELNFAVLKVKHTIKRKKK